MFERDRILYEFSTLCVILTHLNVDFTKVKQFLSFDFDEKIGKMLKADEENTLYIVYSICNVTKVST